MECHTIIESIRDCIYCSTVCNLNLNSLNSHISSIRKERTYDVLSIQREAEMVQKILGKSDISRKMASTRVLRDESLENLP